MNRTIFAKVLRRKKKEKKGKRDKKKPKKPSNSLEIHSFIHSLMNRTISAKVLRRKKKEKKGKKGQKKGKKTSNSIEIQAPLFRKNQSRSNCFQFNEVILETIRRLRFFRKRGALNRAKNPKSGFHKEQN